MGFIIILVYAFLAYWAAKKTVYRNRFLIGDIDKIRIRVLTVGVVLGPILIPIAILRTIFRF